MRPERLASLFIRGAEEPIAGNSMTYTFRFASPPDRQRVVESYTRFIRARPELRVKFVERPGGRGFEWQALSESETDELLTRARADLARTVPQSAADDRYIPTNECLPVRLCFVDDQTLVADVSHVFTNGHGGLYWIRDWWNFHTGAAPDALVDESPASTARAGRRQSRPLFGGFVAVAYAALFAWRAGHRAGHDTVDLTDGRHVTRHAKGYSVLRGQLTESDTAAHVALARTLNRTVNEHALTVLAEALLAARPDQRRVCISMPCDLTRFLPDLDRRAPGNFTGSHIVQVFAGRPLHPQVRSAFAWLHRGVPYHLPRLLGLISGERRIYRHFRAQAATPIRTRAPFENYSAALSLMGRVQLPGLDPHVDRFSCHTKTQTLLFALLVRGGRLAFEVAFANDLFDAVEVRRLTGDFLTRLCGRPVRDAFEG